MSVKFVVNAQGQPMEVVLDVKAYQRLLDQVEDAADIAYLKQHHHDPRIPYEKVRARLKAAGLVPR